MTNSQGVAEFPNLEDTNATAAGTEYAFFVDEDGDATWDSGVEFRRTATVTEYTPTATTLTGVSTDGAAFDFNEYAPGVILGEGDITVTVRDQSGAPLAGEALSGTWTITPFNGDPATTVAAAITDGDADGVYNVAFPGAIEGSYSLNAWIERDGTPGQGAGDLSMTPLSFKAGEAEINWADDAVAQRAAGTTASFMGAMQLADGTGLAARNVTISWTPSGNAVVAAQGSQPGATSRTSDIAATSVTGANGGFSIAIADPAATPNVDELNGTLDATGVDTPGIGDSGALADNLDVDFLADPAVSDDLGDTVTGQTNLSTSAAPGRPVVLDITVRNADGTALTDLPVQVTTDHGFFTTPDATNLSQLNPAPAAAEDANYGEWEDLGTSYNTVTSDTGDARAVVAIERDPGFDDNGLVTANVRFTVGGQTFNEPVVFDSSNPMNPGEVSVVLAPTAQQTVTVLPNAPINETVAFFVRATDQFGNLTDETIDLTDDSADAEITNGSGTPVASVTSQFTNESPEVFGEADAATTQVITGTWNDADTLTWTDAQPAVAGFQEETAGGVDGTDGTATKDLADDAPAINWYVLDVTAADYGINHTGNRIQAVGKTVTVGYRAVDQMGEPIEGLQIRFFRAGPDDLQDGDANDWVITDEAGYASYTYQGAKAGTARVSAVAFRMVNGEWRRIAESERTDVVTFAVPTPARVRINADLGLGNNVRGNDIVFVNGPSRAAGAVVRVYRIRANGTRALVARKVANRNGNVRVVVGDANKRTFQRYQALVGGTARTFADWTPIRRVR